MPIFSTTGASAQVLRFVRPASSPVATSTQPSRSAGINVRALLLDGQSDLGVALPPDLQKAIDRRARVLADEAYGLIREHLQRRVAYHAVAHMPQRVNTARARQVISEGNLGEALARTWHNEIDTILKTSEMALKVNLDAVANIRAAAAQQGRTK